MNMSLALEHKTERPKIDMKEVFKRKDDIKHEHHYNTRSKARKREFDYGYDKNENVNENKIVKCEKKHKHNHSNGNKHEFDHNKVLKFDRQFELYLDDIENITGRRLLDLQRKEIQKAIENNEYRRLSTSESQEHRKEFNKHKKEIIAEWEVMNGEKWTTYDKPVYGRDGKVLRQAGSNYDAHHILECSWGGDNKAWNMIPAAYPTAHQNGIHRRGGFADRIFNQ